VGWIWAGLALVGGAALAMQAGVNSELRMRFGHPALATLTNVLVATGLTASYILVTRLPLPDTETLGGVRWWHWLGGGFGTAYLIIVVVLAPRLGAAPLLSLIVAGQLLAAVALDHFGLLGLPVHAISVGRVVGVVCLIAGAVLIRTT
jgi:transporter family-2 protein